MASSRNSSTTLLLAIYCMVHVAAAVGAGLPAWTLPGSGDSGAHRRRAQSASDKASASPRRNLLQTYTSDVPLAGLSVQVFSPYNDPYTLPIPPSAAPIAVKTASNVNYPESNSSGVFRLAGAGVTANFALRFSGSLNIPGVAPANFTFLLDSDDGSLLMLDGNVVISDPGKHGFNGPKSATVLLVPGVHDIRIDYVQRDGLAGIVLKYSAASTPYYPAANGTVVPSTWFTHLPPGYLPGLAVQTFVPYGSPYTMPIPQDARPSAVTSASSVNYPDVSSGGVMALANATTDFALRFVGVLNLGYQAVPRNQYQYFNYNFTLQSDDGSMLLSGNPGNSSSPYIFIDNSGRHAFSGGTKSSGALVEFSNPNLIAIAIDYSQEAGLAGLVLNVSLQGYGAGPPGPSFVVPPSWFAHKALQTPPPPSPPPPPPPPYECPLCHSDTTGTDEPCCAPKECVSDFDFGTPGCCNANQERCGYFQGDMKGSRCCDYCTFNQDQEGLCCEKYAVVCNIDGHVGTGCCPQGYTCGEVDGSVCCKPGTQVCNSDFPAFCCPDNTVCSYDGSRTCNPAPPPPPPPYHKPPPPKH